MRILVHVCCGPCATYVFKKLLADGHSITGFYYNPNIFPLSEYNKRRDTAKGFLNDLGVECIEAVYHPDDYSAAIGKEVHKPARCKKCFELRLSKTACEAKARNFDAFTSTLLISPYQDQELLRRLGKECAQKQGIGFYEEDFKLGYRKSRGIAGQRRMYQQNYCGCAFSLKGR